VRVTAAVLRSRRRSGQDSVESEAFRVLRVEQRGEEEEGRAAEEQERDSEREEGWRDGENRGLTLR